MMITGSFDNITALCSAIADKIGTEDDRAFYAVLSEKLADFRIGSVAAWDKWLGEISKEDFDAVASGGVNVIDLLARVEDGIHLESETGHQTLLDLLEIICCLLLSRSSKFGVQ